jgi:hypothetical protein
LADGGPLASSEADARKGSYTNAFKKAAAFFGVGRQAYEGSLDDDNLPGESMLHAFHEQAGTPDVEAVEPGCTIALHDLDSDEPLEEQLVGTMDLLIRQEGRIVVVEHKSAARKHTEDQLRFDIQPTAYELAARESGLGDVALRLQVVTKTKVPRRPGFGHPPG